MLAACALAFGLAPVPAMADETTAAAETEASDLRLAEGTYVEHEALALVANDVAVSLARSGADDALSNAEDLMGVSAEAVEEALDDSAGTAAEARSGVSALSASSDSDDGTEAAAEADAAASDARIVLVRDESKTTEELIAELEVDPRVILAEPNYAIDYSTSDEEALQGAIDAALETLDSESNADDADGDTVDDADADGSDDSLGDASTDSAASDETASDGSSGDDAAAGGGGDDGADAAATWSDASDLTEFQWEYDNDGTMGGDGSAGIDMGYDGWNASAGTGSDDVVVAVVDTGVDAANPDLADKMWNRSDYPEFES